LKRRSKKTGEIELTEMAKAGFKLVDCGEDGPDAWAIAHKWNERWDRVRKGEPMDIVAPELIAPRYPAESVGDGYMRAMALRSAERKKNAIVWTKEHESRDDWPRAWKWIEPLFGDVNPKTIRPEDFLSIDNKTGEVNGLLPLIEAKVSVSERHRVVKVWRALWKQMNRFGYCGPEDPSLTIANGAPDPRQATWEHREVLVHVQRAWRRGKRGLAACIAVAWDSMLSPIDARTLTLAQLRFDPESGLPYFKVERAKTGRAAAATLSQWSMALLNAYVADMKDQGIELLPTAPIFRSPGAEPGPKGGRHHQPAPYTKDLLGKHFREVRSEISKEELRKISDMRRSGAVEGTVGGATEGVLSTKMANTLAASARLQKTYSPVHVASVLQFDEHRKIGRDRIGKKGEKS
jgi:hypothetical protein